MNQAFRATIDNEQRTGPGDYRINVEQYTGVIRWTLSRWPVLQVLAAQVSPAATFPRQWTQVPANMTDISDPVLGVYGSSVPSGSGGAGGQNIVIAPGYMGWWNGRNGFRLACSYVNGWPHAGITANVLAGATTLTVDDVTGWTGATGVIYDGANTETVHVTSVTANTPLTLPNSGGTAPAGPGTLTLAAGTTFAHTGATPANVVVSAVPTDVLYANIMICMIQALDAGITSVSIQNIPGSQTQGGHGVAELTTGWALILEPYKRVI